MGVELIVWGSPQGTMAACYAYKDICRVSSISPNFFHVKVRKHSQERGFYVYCNLALFLVLLLVTWRSFW
jgi:hypothetical protein